LWQAGRGSLLQQAFWKQTWPPPQLVAIGMQVPPLQTCVVNVVPVQVAPGQVPQEPLQPSDPHALTGAH
jgi:hypothetical protein